MFNKGQECFEFNEVPEFYRIFQKLILDIFLYSIFYNLKPTCFM